MTRSIALGHVWASVEVAAGPWKTSGARESATGFHGSVPGCPEVERGALGDPLGRLYGALERRSALSCWQLIGWEAIPLV